MLLPHLIDFKIRLCYKKITLKRDKPEYHILNSFPL